MIGITVEEIRARHAGLVAERQKEKIAYQQRAKEQLASEQRDTGYSFVLGELEQMIEELERRAAAEAAAAEAAVAAVDLAAAELLLTTLAEPEQEPDAEQAEC